MSEAVGKSGGAGPERLEGRCLCGSVRFEARAPFRPLIACHCRQCARWTGHLVMATSVQAGHFRFLAGEGMVRWFRASEHAARGFCDTCGSTLFWRPDEGDRISILAGSLEPPTGLVLAEHIFVADKSDYYGIGDRAPQHAGAGPLESPIRRSGPTA